MKQSKIDRIMNHIVKEITSKKIPLTDGEIIRELITLEDEEFDKIINK